MKKLRSYERAKVSEVFLNQKTITKNYGPVIRIETILHIRMLEVEKQLSKSGLNNNSYIKASVGQNLWGLGPNWMEIDSIPRIPETIANSTVAGRAPGSLESWGKYS